MNPHDFRHGNLNPARLPVPPRPRRRQPTCAAAGRRGLYHGQSTRRTTKIGAGASLLNCRFSAAEAFGGARPPASMLVNGSPHPDIAVRIGERLRLRLINATTAQTFWVDTMLVGEGNRAHCLHRRQSREVANRGPGARAPGPRHRSSVRGRLARSHRVVDRGAICAAKRRPAAGLRYRPAASCANRRW